MPEIVGNVCKAVGKGVGPVTSLASFLLELPKITEEADKKFYKVLGEKGSEVEANQANKSIYIKNIAKYSFNGAASYFAGAATIFVLVGTAPVTLPVGVAATVLSSGAYLLANHTFNSIDKKFKLFENWK